LPGLLTPLQKTFEEANKEQTLDWLVYFNHCKPTRLTSWEYWYEYRDEPYTLQYLMSSIVVSKSFIPMSFCRHIFQVKGIPRVGDGHHSYGRVRNKMNADGE
jgi:hypothetical protein